MVFFHQQLQSNLVRVNYNSYWWDTDAYVPNAHTHYRQWLQTYVHLEELAGNYVELDTGPNFHAPPCGNDGMGHVVTFCPSQNQGTKTNDPTQSIDYQPTPLQSLADLSAIYANDPAILFDVWNEPFLSTLHEATYIADMDQRINAVRAHAPHALVIVFARYYPLIMQGKAPNYAQPNLLFDHHIYSASFTTPQLLPELQFAHAHGQGVIVNEYGGVTPSSSVMNQLAVLASAYDVPLAYFQAGNLVDQQGLLNANGVLVQNAYAQVLG
jgi:hypothetical protein